MPIVEVLTVQIPTVEAVAKQRRPGKKGRCSLYGRCTTGTAESSNVSIAINTDTFLLDAQTKQAAEGVLTVMRHQ